jgi:serine/threonine-protein kinase
MTPETHNTTSSGRKTVIIPISPTPAGEENTGTAAAFVPARSGTVLWDRYTKVEALGEGGMGTVIRARDPGLERDVAIKRLRTERANDPETRRRFLQEARATGQLEHPNIPPVYEMGRDENDAPYFALKLVRGKSLHQIIQGLRVGDPSLHRQYNFTHRLIVFQKVCEAVAYAHERGVIHRDIKPANIMVGAFGEVFLMDWGLAKDHLDPLQSQAGSFFGTPTYAAPEHVSGEAADKWTDIYSLGATLYEWLSLHPPFSGPNARAVLAAIVTTKPTDPVFLTHRFQGRVPVEMSRLITKAMHADRQKRFEDVSTMMSEIESILDGDIAPVCPCTTVKFGFHLVSKWINNYPIVVVLVIAWLLWPLYAIIYAIWVWLSA